MTTKIKIPALSIIVAVDEEGGFGLNGKIPWNINEDMEHFRNVTSGGICIMGKNTYEDIHAIVSSRKKKDAHMCEQDKIDGSPHVDDNKVLIDTPILADRQSFVITTDINYKTPGVTPAISIANAIQMLDEHDNRQIFVIGGYRLFVEALSWTNMIYMTVIKNKRYNCDRFFPIEVLNKYYKIIDGKETDKLYFLTYKTR